MHQRTTAFIVTLACVLLATSVFAQSPVARLTDLTGVATARHGDQWQLLSHTPVDLYDGDKVNTDRGRATILFLGDESTLVLDVGTNITIHQTTTPSGFARRVSIFLGDVWFKMTKTATQNTALVTPTAVGGLRGTEGQVHVESDSESSFTLNEGELAIQQREADGSLSRSARPVRLRGGEVLGAVRGQPFVPRRALARVERPDVKVAPERLPQLRPDHQSRLRMTERPRGVPGAGMRGGPGMRGLRRGRREPADGTEPGVRGRKGAAGAAEPGAAGAKPPEGARKESGAPEHAPDASARKGLVPATKTPEAAIPASGTPAAGTPADARKARREAAEEARAQAQADAKTRADAAAKAKADADAAAKAKAAKEKKAAPVRRK